MHKRIRRKIREAKEKWCKGKCGETEDLMTRNDNFNLDKKVKKMVGVYGTKGGYILLNGKGKIITDTKERLGRWYEYIQEFQDERQQAILKEGITVRNPDVIKEEI